LTRPVRPAPQLRTGHQLIHNHHVQKLRRIRPWQKNCCV
jgi:hypothetical protein